MTSKDIENSELLLRQAASGDDHALTQLIGLYRARLKAMVQLRTSNKLKSRLDDSDIIQEAMLEVARRLEEYLREPTVPFYLWLRQITIRKLIDVHRRHLTAERRDVDRELRLGAPAADSASLAVELTGNLTSPTRAALRVENRAHVQDALKLMEPIDREVLALRHFEQLSNAEAALVLGVEPSAASKRYTRAVQRLKKILDDTIGSI